MHRECGSLSASCEQFVEVQLWRNFHAFRVKQTAEESLVPLAIRVARVLGSPVARVVLGNMEDRRSAGGIEARMEDTLKVCKACRSHSKSGSPPVSSYSRVSRQPRSKKNQDLLLWIN